MQFLVPFEEQDCRQGQELTGSGRRSEGRCGAAACCLLTCIPKHRLCLLMDPDSKDLTRLT